MSIGAVRVARLHGVFNVLAGLWPVIHRRSFEAVFGPKGDWWLVYTVAGLMICIGGAQLSTETGPGAVRQMRRVGMGCSATLGIIDAVYVARGRISPMYLLDAVAETGWLVAWGRARILPS